MSGISGPSGGEISLSAVQLKNGRHLAFSQYGDPNGYPVLYMHGNLNSRLFRPSWDKTQDISSKCGARVIAFDRPGYGMSDFDPNRSYLSWVDDVREFASLLELKRFAVLGYSSGGPNALVCALHLPQVSACGLISSDAPYSLMGEEIVAKLFGTERSKENLISRSIESAEGLKAAYSSMKKVDRGEMALADLAEATRQGVECGPSQDGLLESQDWKFELGLNEGGCNPPLLMWHGDEDADVPIEAGRFLLAQLQAKTRDGQSRRVEAHFIKGESHSLIRRHWEGILTKLVEKANQSVAPSL